MEKKKENLIMTFLDKHPGFIYWAIQILIMLAVAAVAFGIVVVQFGLPHVYSFYIEFAFCAAAALVSLIFTIHCFIQHKCGSAVMLAAVVAVSLFFSVRFALDLPYVSNPRTMALHNITMDMKIRYSDHDYMLYGYDEEGKKHSLEIDVNDYYDYRCRADTAVISYLPYSHKIMNIDFFNTSSETTP